MEMSTYPLAVTDRPSDTVRVTVKPTRYALLATKVFGVLDTRRNLSPLVDVPANTLSAMFPPVSTPLALPASLALIKACTAHSPVSGSSESKSDGNISENERPPTVTTAANDSCDDRK